MTINNKIKEALKEATQIVSEKEQENYNKERAEIDEETQRVFNDIPRQIKQHVLISKTNEMFIRDSNGQVLSYYNNKNIQNQSIYIRFIESFVSYCKNNKLIVDFEQDKSVNYEKTYVILKIKESLKSLEENDLKESYVPSGN